MFIYIYIHTHIYIYIYIYVGLEARRLVVGRAGQGPEGGQTGVSTSNHYTTSMHIAHIQPLIITYIITNV